ncbi:16S rRNA processing protein RimM [Bacteroides sp. 214]|uniref:ribosome maturation factor RimM n=1 Tax=Bacteroides sp. 214 TaxID=2302935 RepID=UPI0013D4D20F|nr:ribosome maturation factor RimM [Bacteroides sp. 214]NDW11758.1 16S rRNA processing protein RimM [Bacteroides sp. 214]
MIKEEEVYKIGQFNKPHGIHGELSFTFTDDIFDRVEECDYLICLLDGIYVPFFIEEYRFRSDSTALIKLEDINSTEAARKFTNVEVYFPVKYVTDEEVEDASWTFFIGFTLRDVETGDIGEIVDVDDTTVNVLFVVDHAGEEVLIPASEELMVEIDQMHKVIAMRIPTGLLTLDDADEIR